MCEYVCVLVCVYVRVYVCVFGYVCSSMILFIDQQMGRWDLSLGRSISRRAGGLSVGFLLAYMFIGGFEFHCE